MPGLFFGKQAESILELKKSESASSSKTTTTTTTQPQPQPQLQSQEANAAKQLLPCYTPRKVFSDVHYNSSASMRMMTAANNDKGKTGGNDKTKAVDKPQGKMMVAWWDAPPPSPVLPTVHALPVISDDDDEDAAATDDKHHRRLPNDDDTITLDKNVRHMIERVKAMSCNSSTASSTLSVAAGAGGGQQSRPPQRRPHRHAQLQYVTSMTIASEEENNEINNTQDGAGNKDDKQKEDASVENVALATMKENVLKSTVIAAPSTSTTTRDNGLYKTSSSGQSSSSSTSSSNNVNVNNNKSSNSSNALSNTTETHKAKCWVPLFSKKHRSWATAPALSSTSNHPAAEAAPLLENNKEVIMVTNQQEKTTPSPSMGQYSSSIATSNASRAATEPKTDDSDRTDTKSNLTTRPPSLLDETVVKDRPLGTTTSNSIPALASRVGNGSDATTTAATTIQQSSRTRDGAETNGESRRQGSNQDSSNNDCAESNGSSAPLPESEDARGESRSRILDPSGTAQPTSNHRQERALGAPQNNKVIGIMKEQARAAVRQSIYAILDAYDSISENLESAVDRRVSDGFNMANDMFWEAMDGIKEDDSSSCSESEGQKQHQARLKEWRRQRREAPISLASPISDLTPDFPEPVATMQKRKNKTSQGTDDVDRSRSTVNHPDGKGVSQLSNIPDRTRSAPIDAKRNQQRNSQVPSTIMAVPQNKSGPSSWVSQAKKDDRFLYNHRALGQEPPNPSAIRWLEEVRKIRKVQTSTMEPLTENTKGKLETSPTGRTTPDTPRKLSSRASFSKDDATGNMDSSPNATSRAKNISNEKASQREISSTRQTNVQSSRKPSPQISHARRDPPVPRSERSRIASRKGRSSIPPSKKVKNKLTNPSQTPGGCKSSSKDSKPMVVPSKSISWPRKCTGKKHVRTIPQLESQTQRPPALWTTNCFFIHGIIPSYLLPLPDLRRNLCLTIFLQQIQQVIRVLPLVHRHPILLWKYKAIPKHRPFPTTIRKMTNPEPSLCRRLIFEIAKRSRPTVAPLSARESKIISQKDERIIIKRRVHVFYHAQQRGGAHKLRSPSVCTMCVIFFLFEDCRLPKKRKMIRILKIYVSTTRLV